MKDFIRLARESVANHYWENYNPKVMGFEELKTSDDVFVVWSCKTLQNKKAILSSSITGFPLYEFTWNGDKNEGYLDCYKKIDNKVIKGE